MIIKNNFFKNFIENIFSYKAYLVYGPDKGLVKERSSIIIKKLKSISTLDIKKPSQLDLDNQNLLDLIFQKNIFSVKSIINLDLEYLPSFKFSDNFFSSITSSSGANYLLLEAGNLTKADGLIKIFSRENKLACIPCYHDTEITIPNTISEYAKKFNLIIDNESLDYLSKKLGSDKLQTMQEIKKLSIYANGKAISFDDVLHLIGDSSLISINKICDNLFTSNKSPYLYEKLIESGINNIIIIRSLLNHFQFLLNKKINKNEKELGTFIHFSRHKLINMQLLLLSEEKIKKVIENILELEKKVKSNYTLANILVKKFLLSYSAIK